MKKLSLALGLVLCSIGAMLAQRTVTGTVTDQNGVALIGASVLVKGTTSGTITEIDGTYSVRVPEGSNVIVFSYTGFETVEVALGASNVVDVAMAEGVTLETAVVTALGVTKEEKSIGYAVQQVESAELLKANEANFVQSLAGKVAGLQVTGSTGTAGASSFFLIRGANTISGSNQPLIVVDGVPIDNSQLRSGVGGAVASVAFSNRAIDLNQNEIESVTVLKGAAATALYGSLAGNGAIIITTKKGMQGDQKVSVDFSTNLTFNQTNQLPALQTTYGQGLSGAYAGPETGSPFSWGPLIDTMRYSNADFPFTSGQDRDKNGEYDWNANGLYIVGQSSEYASGTPVESYDHYDFFQTGVASNSNLAISAATASSSVRFSVGYLDETGIVPNNTFNRMNFGLNADTKLGKKINLGIGIQYINSGGNRIEQGSNTSGVMLGLLRSTPTFDNSNGLEDAGTNPDAYSFADGRPRGYRGNAGNGTSRYDNPYWTANNNPLKDNVNRVIGNFNLSYKPADWLTFTWRPGVDFYSDLRKQYFAIYSATLAAGQVFEDQYFSKRWNSDLIATITPEISDNFSLSFTLGHNIREFRLDNLYTQGDGLVIPGFYDISNASVVRSVSDNNVSRNTGFFGVLDLGFNQWLYLTGTARMESDLSLPEDNNTYLYYSAGASVVLSEALGMNSDVLSFVKLRGSFGRVGLGTFAYSTDTYFTQGSYADGWTNGLNFPFLGNSAFTFGETLGNPELKPEIRDSWEVGADLRFFRNRIRLDLAYYSSVSKDIILDVPITASSGHQFFTRNSAQLSNKGIEAVLDMSPVRTKDFNWDLMVNFTRNVNNVDALADGVDQVFLGGFTGASTRAVVDVPYGSIFGFGFYRDANGDRVINPDTGFPVLDPNERSFNSALPDFTVGIRNTFSFKGLSLSALLDIKEGGYLWNGTKGALYYFGTHQETADRRGTMEVFEGSLAELDAEGNIVFWDHDGDEGTSEIPRTTGANTAEVLVDENWLAFDNANGFFGDNTEDFVEEASWFRLRDVSLSYSLPKSALKGAKMQYLTITLSGRNLFLSTPYTGVDPETNLYGASNAQGLDYFNMPGTKSYTVGLQVGF